MSDSPSTKNTSTQTKILTVFMIVALAVCISVLSTLDTSSVLAIEQPTKLMLGLMIQIMVTGVYIFAWQVNLRRCGVVDLSFHDSILHSGIAFLGKYIPGKVGGLIMRGMTAHKRTQSTSIIVKATTIEQVTMIHAGLLVCCVAWSVSSDFISLLLLLALSALSFLVVLFPKHVVEMTRRFTNNHPRLAAVLDVFEEDFQQTYFVIFLLMVIIWLLSALSLSFVLQGFSIQIPFDKVLVITTMAFLTGFFAVFLPAGIGAREGALVLLLSPYCSTATALTVATLHRIITVTIDLVIGSYALQKIPKS